jgi:DNA-binding transcriptional regulator YhcF (GntR family)
MCRAVEEYAKERERIAVEKANEESAKKTAEEIAQKSVRFVESLLKKGFSLEEALEMAEIDEDTYNSHRIA